MRRRRFAPPSASCRLCLGRWGQPCRGTAASLSATISVEDQMAHSVLEAQMPSLNEGLSATFARVHTDLIVDTTVSSRTRRTTSLNFRVGLW